MIRSLLATLVLVIAPSLALAQSDPAPEEAWTLADVLAAAPDADPGVRGARNDLASAERALARTESDPLATGLELLDARQAVEAAGDALGVAEANAVRDATAGVTAVLEARSALELALSERDIEATRLEAVRARAAAGAATALGVTEAENDALAAQRAASEAEADLALALAELAALVDADVADVVPLTAADVPEAPTLDEAAERAPLESAGIRAARRALASAEASLAAIDNALASDVEIEEAKDALADAEADLATALGDLGPSLRRAYLSLDAARNGLAGADDSLAASEDSLAGQRARFEAGSISGLAFDEATVAYRTAEASRDAALHTWVLAALDAELAVLE
jgi:outer membrane protein TolC